MFAYGRDIHDHCPRRAHFDAGRFAQRLRRRGAPPGLVPLQDGLQGPDDPRRLLDARTSTRSPDAWPIGIGLPCFGCTEQRSRSRVPIFEKSPVTGRRRRSPTRAIHPETGTSTRWRPGIAGTVVGALVGAAYVASKKLAGDERAEREDEGRGTAAMSVSLPAHAAQASGPRGRPRGRRGAAAGRRRDDADAGRARRRRDALRRDEVHRLQGLRGRVRRDQRPDPRHGAVGRALAMPTDLNTQTKNVIKLYEDRRRRAAPSSSGSACTASIPPASRPACSARCRRARKRHRLVGRRPAASVAGTARSPAPSRSRSSSGRSSPEDRQVRDVPARARPRGGQPGCTRRLPARGGGLRPAQRPARGGEAARRRAPGRYHRDRVYGEHEAGGTQVLYLSKVPFEKLGLPMVSDRPRPLGNRQGGVLKFVVPGRPLRRLSGLPPQLEGHEEDAAEGQRGRRSS